MRDAHELITDVLTDVIAVAEVPDDAVPQAVLDAIAERGWALVGPDDVQAAVPERLAIDQREAVRAILLDHSVKVETAASNCRPLDLPSVDDTTTAVLEVLASLAAGTPVLLVNPGGYPPAEGGA